MDRSVDSIGSCSLDVDADSSDISDTSGSLNFPTPLSVKDITREFTANIRERCSVRTVQNSTVLIDPNTGQVRMVLTQPTATNNTNNINANANANANINANNNSSSNNIATTTRTTALKTITATTTTSTVNNSGGVSTTSALPLTPADVQSDKKPSYLNLACCVNGYSNLTTYDSKIRQDINKSREVSPIRPSSSSLQYCKKNNALAPPILHTMPNVSLTNGGIMQPPHTKQPTATGHKFTESNNNNNNGNNINNNNGTEHLNNIMAGESNDEYRHTSFIQQRVERLYGPGALAQGFYSPKKVRSSHCMRVVHVQQDGGSTELSRKFQELSPSRDYSEFRKKLDANNIGNGGVNNLARRAESSTAVIEHSAAHNNSIDLPVFRHLSQEFRAQLPSISPKRNVTRASPARDANANGNGNAGVQNGVVDKPIETTTTATINADATTVKPTTTTTITMTTDEIDHSVVTVMPAVSQAQAASVVIESNNKSEVHKSLNNSKNNVELPAATTSLNNGTQEKDGNYFLHLLKTEQLRLLALAADAEKYIEALTNNPEINEDILGFLRSASGKARLLVSQKMKQFEGLCHNNLNRSPEDKFPTTVDDLQGFWDMVHLQIDHIDSIYADIEILKNNDWKKPNKVNSPASKAINSNAATAAVNVTKTQTQTQKQPTKTANAKAKANNTANGNSLKPTVSAAALKREAQRKQLMEMKRKNRMAMAAANVANSTTTADASETNATNGSGTSKVNTIEVLVHEKTS